MTSKIYALVRWISGEDRNKMTVLKSSWVKDFSSWTPGDEDSYVVEWRDSKSRPVGGWKCYDAIIINASDVKSELEKQLEEASKKKEGHLHFAELANIMDSDVDDSDADPPYEPDIKRHKSQDVAHKKKKGESSHRPKDLEKEVIPTQAKKPEVVKTSLQTFLEKEFKKIHEKLDEIKNMQGARGGISTTVSTASAPPQVEGENLVRQPCMAKKVELYPGTGVFCDEVAWISASTAQTAGSFISTLLVNLFPEEVLLKSNLKGGVNKTDKNLERKDPLDPKIIQALRLAAQKKFSGLTGGRFGAYVNNKLGNLRHKKKCAGTTPAETTEDN